ncbi:MAG: zf-HC2 domain-containing protein, partial [Candidatus Brocadiae bacterium]|nr:zf-HC2 domain-containing protein [Candidatus Brocadiia bacterium]
MDCTVMKRTFPALMAGDLPVAETAQAEEHLLHCESCSREFEAYESRFYMQYEPAGKAMAAASKAALPELQVEKFQAALKARLQGDCPRVEGLFTRFLGNELSRAESDGVAAHLQGCEPCSRAFEAYEGRVFGQVEPAGMALEAAAKCAPPEGPMVGFWNRIAARIAEDRRRASWRRMTWALNAAALLIIGVSLSYLVAGQAPV